MAPGLILAGAGVFAFHFLLPSPEEEELGVSGENPYEDLDQKNCLLRSDLKRGPEVKAKEQAIGFLGALRIP